MRATQLSFPRLYGPAPVYALAIILGAILDLTGALHVYGVDSLMSQKLATGAALVLTMVAAGWVLLALQAQRGERAIGYTQPASEHASRALQRILTLLMLLGWLATARDYLLFLAPAVSLPGALAFAGGALALLYSLIRPPPAGWLAACAIVLGGAVRVASFRYVPIEPSHGDMLPLVRGAIGNLLAGQSPYTIYHMPWDLPLTYFPATWLAYLAPYALGVDIRAANLLAELAIGAAVFWLAAARCKTTGGGQPAAWRDERGLLLWAWVFLQPTALNWSLVTTAPIFWALLAALLAALVAGRHGRAALFLGLCAAASPLTVVIAPFAVLCWLRASGIRSTAYYMTIAALIPAIFILPFLAWSPGQFIFGTWRWFNDNELFPRMRWEMDNTWARMVGFSGIFWRHNLVEALKPLQGLLLAGLAALFWRRGATRSQIAPFSVAAFLLFTVFNPILWPYLYYPALVAALIAVAALDRMASSGATEIRKRCC